MFCKPVHLNPKLNPATATFFIQSGLFKLLMPLPSAGHSTSLDGQNVLFLLHPKQTLATVANLIRTELLAVAVKAPPTTSPAQSIGTIDSQVTFYGRFKDPSELLSSGNKKTKIASRWALSSSSTSPFTVHYSFSPDKKSS